ncbi:hypothetical protein PSMA108079_10480 [Pseudoalteromonas mariniglutinosa]|uniref:hypothetical protein n=1 Tax=Pseudoalteromonas mariniglutinosa TaxID=206042 RepID=UPI000ACFC73A|nr:hypothetical protein [Pseudoalteromonas mariniglutinosa]
MSKFISGESRDQSTLFPESLEDYVSEDNTVSFHTICAKIRPSGVTRFCPKTSYVAK